MSASSGPGTPWPAGGAKKFVQSIDFETERMDEMERVFEEARRCFTDRPGGPTQRMLLKDRDNPRRCLALIEFDSYQEAMRNSNDPETSRMAEQLGALCIGERVYTNCDLLDEREFVEPRRTRTRVAPRHV